MDTANDNALVIHFYYQCEVNATGDVSAITDPGGNFTARLQETAGQDPDLQFSVVSRVQDVAGTIDETPTWTLTTTGTIQGIALTFAIKSGSAGLTINPSLLQRLASTIDPTVVPSDVTITPDILQELLEVFNPTLITQAFIVPSLLQQLAATIDPTVLPPNAPINPSLLQQLIQVIDPALTTVVTITPDLVQQTAVVYDPVVTAGSSEQTLEPTLMSQPVQTINPTVVVSDVTILPDLLQQLVVAISPAFVGDPSTPESERQRSQGWS